MRNSVEIRWYVRENEKEKQAKFCSYGDADLYRHCICCDTRWLCHFAADRWQRTDLEETKEQSYEAHYAFIVDNPEDEYWQQVYEAAKEEGKKQNIYVEQIFENVSQTYETKEYMDIAIAEKVDGILLQSSSKSVGPEMNAAMEAGIPVVTMLHDNYSGRRCAFVGVNDSSLGDSYAELIQENISKKKKDVLLLMKKNGDLGDNNLVLQTIRQKVQGAKIRVQLLEGEDEFATEKAVRDCILDEKSVPGCTCQFVFGRNRICLSGGC